MVLLISGTRTVNRDSSAVVSRSAAARWVEERLRSR
ncbi:hypothetical protein I3842_16G088200 [Carya illinoinensis]|uniref:Uncharacterized protein n=1 Tax=Carya illinoinensis TaxID=32201 RepID=A0A922D181_CARIL|nr:hypothetical protein I3842_16G088200 [Carya illinoinensis]